MRKAIAIIWTGLLCFAGVSAQDKNADVLRASAEAKAMIQKEIRDAKRRAASGEQLSVPVPADFNDTDSFGKEVKFLGSLYAGTVFIAPTCSTPDVPPNLAPDDKCLPKALNQNIPSTVFTDPAWQITIPGKAVKNVIYLMMNNSVVFDNSFGPGNTLGGQGIMSYSLVVTIENEALNSPLAINPNTNTPMNGVFETGLPGTKFRSRIFTAGSFEQEVDSYASVNGRGISRAFWRDVGLPDSVIDNFYKKDTTLKFGIRVSQFGAVAFGQYFYTFRAIGQ